MRVFYDLEFFEDGTTIILISIGMVAEDGREYYAVNRDLPARRIRKHRWLMDNVVPSLPHGHGDRKNSIPAGWLIDYTDPCVKMPSTIAGEVEQFIKATPSPELWAWYGAYDHVCLAQLWGPMTNLPEVIPMWTNDLRQEAHRLGDPPLPEQTSGEHNALADARHNLARAQRLAEVAASRTGFPKLVRDLEAVHYPIDGGAAHEECADCLAAWPCPTARALHEERAAQEPAVPNSEELHDRPS